MINENQLILLEEELRIAMLAGDVKKLQILLADNLIFISQTGGVISKTEDIAVHNSGLLKISKINIKERNLRCLINAGVAVVLTEVEGSYKDEPFSGTFRYTRVWSFERDKWQIVNAQTTLVI